MQEHSVRRRVSFFVAVEGASEQSFVAWLQMLSQQHLRLHLDIFRLGGGGFKSMLQKAVRMHQLNSGFIRYQMRFLILDGDRAEQGDWPIDKLRHEAAKHKMMVCVQSPNLEGLLLRMMPGMERENTNAALAATKLKRLWPSYRKPMSAQELARRFSLEDLLRVAKLDPDLQNLVKATGLMS